MKSFCVNIQLKALYQFFMWCCLIVFVSTMECLIVNIRVDELSEQHCSKFYIKKKPRAKSKWKHLLQWRHHVLFFHSRALESPSSSRVRSNLLISPHESVTQAGIWQSCLLHRSYYCKGVLTSRNNVLSFLSILNISLYFRYKPYS